MLLHSSAITALRNKNGSDLTLLKCLRHLKTPKRTERIFVSVVITYIEIAQLRSSPFRWSSPKHICHCCWIAWSEYVGPRLRAEKPETDSFFLSTSVC